MIYTSDISYLDHYIEDFTQTTFYIQLELKTEKCSLCNDKKDSNEHTLILC